MANEYFKPTTETPFTLARAESINANLSGVETGFDKLPTEANIKRGTVNYGVDSGAADAYVVDLPHAPSAYTDGLQVNVKIGPGNTNTGGACTINVNGLGAVAVKTHDGTDPVASDFPAGAVIPLRHNGTQFRVVGATPGNAAAAAASADAAAAEAAAALNSANNSAASAGQAATSESNAAAFATQVEDAKLIWQSDWSGATPYGVNDAVQEDGSSYICIQAHTNQQPPNAVYWDVLALRGAPGAGTGDMLGSNNLTDLANAATAFDNIKQAATTTTTGVAELATDGEAQAKADTARVLTPSNLAALGATETFAGLVERASTSEAIAGVDDARYMTPAKTLAQIQNGGFTMAGEVNMADQNLVRPQIRDYSLPRSSDATFTGVETIDYSAGNVHELTLTGDVSALTINNWPAAGNEGRLTLYINQDSTPRTIAWEAAINWGESGQPDLSTANATYVVVLTGIDGGTSKFGFLAGGPFT